MQKKSYSKKNLLSDVLPSPYDLFVTITYPNIVGRCKFQYESTYPELIKQLQGVGIFKAYPEFTLKSQIHWHILLQQNDKYKYHKSFVPYMKRQGYFVVVKINNFQNVQNYCEKDVGVNQRLLEVMLPLTERHVPLRRSRWRRLIKKYSQDIAQDKINISQLDESVDRHNEWLMKEIKSKEQSYCDSYIEARVEIPPTVPHGESAFGAP